MKIFPIYLRLQIKFRDKTLHKKKYKEICKKKFNTDGILTKRIKIIKKDPSHRLNPPTDILWQGNKS